MLLNRPPCSPPTLLLSQLRPSASPDLFIVIGPILLSSTLIFPKKKSDYILPLLKTLQ